MYPAGKQAGHFGATAHIVPLCTLQYLPVAVGALSEGAWHHVQVCTTADKQLVKQLELLLYSRQQQGLWRVPNLICEPHLSRAGLQRAP